MVRAEFFSVRDVTDSLTLSEQPDEVSKWFKNQCSTSVTHKNRPSRIETSGSHVRLSLT